ncbi:MAG: methyltransferase domain-containing protein, partial [Acidimicrobiales bacterium]
AYDALAGWGPPSPGRPRLAGSAARQAGAVTPSTRGADVEDQDYETTYQLEGDNWWFVGMRHICLGLLAPATGAVPEGGRRVLDVGCGTGIVLDHLSPWGVPTGLDPSPLGLAFCQARGADRLVRAFGEHLPFATASFDTLTAFGVVEHIDDDRAAVAEWYRVLRPGGQLVLLTSAYQWLWSGHDVSNHHTRRYVVGEVDGLLRGAGLVPSVVSYVNTALFPGIAAVRLVERIARRGRPPVPNKDTAEVPPAANRVLTKLLDAEGAALRRGYRLPFGVSIVARATKPPA